MIYADLESILVPEHNGKQNPNDSYTKKYKKHVACADDKFSKPFKSYLGKDAVYNFISSIIEESEYCSDVKIIYFLIILILLNNINNIKSFNKELVMSKTNNEDFENSTKCWVCDNHYIDNDVKLRDHYHTTGKYRVSAHRVCNINVCNIKLNHKVPVVFRSLINHDSHLFT